MKIRIHSIYMYIQLDLTRFSVRIAMKGQEDTHESWQKTISGWMLGSIYFFSQRIVKIWNSLSEEVISAGSVITFKKRLEDLRKMKKVSLMD